MIGYKSGLYVLVSLLFCSLLSVILYLFFLFIVVIVLLNVLIAQVSDTYTKVLAKAEVYTHFYQCLYIARLERSHCTICKIRPLHFFLQKLKLCGIFCSNCCKHLVCGCCAQGRESLVSVPKPKYFCECCELTQHVYMRGYQSDKQFMLILNFYEYLHNSC